MSRKDSAPQRGSNRGSNRPDDPAAARPGTVAAAIGTVNASARSSTRRGDVVAAAVSRANPPSVTQAQFGNSVPPLMSHSVACAVGSET